MNHQTVEFLARDRIAGLRMDVDRLGSDRAEPSPWRPPPIAAGGVVRRLLARFTVGTFVAGRHR